MPQTKGGREMISHIPVRPKGSSTRGDLSLQEYVNQEREKLGSLESDLKSTERAFLSARDKASKDDLRKKMENIKSKIKSKESSVAEINEKITRLINEVETSDDSSEDGDDD